MSTTTAKKHHGPRTASVACYRGLWMMQIDIWLWSHTCWGHMVLTGPQICKWVKFYILRLSYKLTSHDHWPSFMTFDLMNMHRLLHYIKKVSLNFTFWAHLTSWPLMTFNLGIWSLTTWTCNKSHNVSINQVWFQSDFNFLNEATFTFSAYFTTWPQTIFDLDMWPLTSLTNEGSHVASMTQLWLKSIKACGS